MIWFTVIDGIIDPDTPTWFQRISWIAILSLFAVGIFTLYAEKILNWANRKEAELKSRLKR
ncbi:hypothetical protein [Enterovibrio calviensis]|uniref:hypothetical protein n=1 Tax=Enterovibrio calviensis TaxID=91359 RepID=UPI003734FD9D